MHPPSTGREGTDIDEPTVRSVCQPNPDHLLAGIYRHYKSKHYLVLGLSFDANIEGRTAVIYVPLYTDPALPGPRMCHRTAADFFADIDPHSGLAWDDHRALDHPPCDCSSPIKRFTYLGPTFAGFAAEQQSP